MPKVVYRATPAASADHHAAYTDALAARNTERTAFLKRHGLDPQTPAYALEEGAGNIVAFQYKGTPPAGWRIDRKIPGAIVPNARTKKGKQIAQEMAAIPHANPRRLLPGGMPDRCVAGHILMDPSVEMVGDHLFVGWSRALPGPTTARLDPNVWESVPLWSYYLARETEEARATTDA